MDQDLIRNFSIIAHIDHGKSTLADRILELTHAVSSRDMRAQVLDTMELERERGITIKAQAVRVLWKGHQLNLIDTPGHVDFTYEVSRSLQACEGAILVVDAAQGIEAQTLANAYLAIENDLEIVPVVNGAFPTRAPLRAMALGPRLEAQELGFFAPVLRPTGELSAGEVGYVMTGLKDVSELRVGDTITSERNPASEPVPGYKEVKPMVFAGLFPTDSDAYPELRDALERLKLNDAALIYEPETSNALGFGFRCGFLGLLHMEIVRERLEREFDLDLIVTAPNVAYRVKPPNGEWKEVHTPADMPNEVEDVEEPYIKASIIVPKEYVGVVMELNNDRRGRFDHMEYLSEERVHLMYELPLADIVLDYYDQLKSRTRGYASFDYDIIGFRPGKLVRVDILVGGEPVDALSVVIHRDSAYDRGRALVERLREEIPRQHFDVAIQAAIGARVIARETVKARRKDWVAKGYGAERSLP